MAFPKITTWILTCLSLAALILLVACNQSGAERASATASAEILGNPARSTLTPAILSTPSPEIVTPTLQAEASPDPALPASFPSIQYKINALFDYYQHQLKIEQDVVYTNRSEQPIPDLLLAVEANRWSGSFLLELLAWTDGGAITDYSLSDNRLHIPLPEPLPTGGSLGLRISYSLLLPEIPPPSELTRPHPYGYTERQTNLVDWYPTFPPYRSGEGWLLHEPWYYAEHQVYDIADYQVTITLLDPPDGLVLAASAMPEVEGESYTYNLSGARSFAWSASPYYEVASETVGDVLVSSYYFPFDSEAGAAVLQHTVDALTLYTELFGAYPHASLSAVEADFLDGMEYSGLYFLSRGFYNLYDGTPKGYLTAIAAHETAHQWWFERVGNDQALEPWLDEALCAYAERLFYARFYPDLVEWWWYFRVDYYQPSGPVNGTIYDFTGFRPYRDAVYLHGALFLEDLRNLVGDEAFFAFLSDYTARFTLAQAQATDFFTVLNEHSSVDISLLKSQYFSK